MTPATGTSRSAVDRPGEHAFVVHSFMEWRERMCARYVPLDARTDRVDGFRASLRSRSFGGVSLSRIAVASHTVERPQRLIGVNDSAYYKFSLQLSGTGLVVQDGRQAVLTPGDMAIYDTSRPYSLVFHDDDVQSLVVVCPQELISVPAAAVSRMTAVRVPGDDGMGQMVGSFLRQLAENMETFSGGNAERITRNALDLISTLLYVEADLGAGNGPASGLRLAATVKDYIDRNLADPLLSPSSIAEANFISTRRLHYLFRDEGTTVTAWIKARRLERCRLELSDPCLRDDTVTRIAQRWGFVDAAHFSRCFKSAYGMSPRNYRLRWRQQPTAAAS